jgi:hypothetical protein
MATPAELRQRLIRKFNEAPSKRVLRPPMVYRDCSQR